MLPLLCSRTFFLNTANQCLIDSTIRLRALTEPLVEYMPAIFPRNMIPWWKSSGTLYDRSHIYISIETCTELRQPNVEIMQNGHLVSRCSDFIIYSVEAKNIDAVVKAFGPCMKFVLIEKALH